MALPGLAGGAQHVVEAPELGPSGKVKPVILQAHAARAVVGGTGECQPARGVQAQEVEAAALVGGERKCQPLLGEPGGEARRGQKLEGKLVGSRGRLPDVADGRLASVHAPSFCPA